MAAMRLTLLALCVLGAVSIRGVLKQKVTPVQKTIELLASLQTQLEAEAKAEATQYDKFACFCKEQIDEIVYEDEAHVKNLADLDAEILKLDAAIKLLNIDIGTLGGQITGLDATIKREAGQRARDHSAYKAWAAELASAISALERATNALKDAKDDQSEEVKINLVQVRKMAAALGLNQDPETYEFRSNDIISTLEGLHKQFIGKQNEHDKTEFDANAAWESRDLDNKNEKKFKEADKAEKEKISAYKDEVKGKTQADRDAVAEEKRRNDAYLVDVKNECQDKAQLWDQRSQMRAGEITAVSEALALLKAKVNAQFGANKKLVGLQVQKAGPKSPTLSFLQISTGDRLRGANKVDSKGSKAITQKAAVLLSNAGRSLGSKTLALAAVRMLASDDHFVKVRSIINDLISRLESDARSEQTQKDLCDTGMSQGVRNRDSAQAALESTSATITKSEAAQATAAAAVAELSEQIAQMQKAIIEMTDLRMAEKAENQKTIATAKVGEQGIIDAIEIIRPFYEMAENSLVQLTTFSPLPSAAAKDNKEYRDTAPEIFQGKYHGDQKASKGILGLMDVIISDFERTINKVGGDESAAVINYDIDKKAMDGLVSQMSIEKTRQEGEVTRLGKVILGLEGNLKSEKTSKQTALDALSALESSCVDGEETYDERVAARNKEIQALQDAQNILNDWQGF